jgi:hypothetical protein
VADTLLGNAPAPINDEVVGKEGKLTLPWLNYLNRLPPTLYAIPSRLNVVALTAQGASISATSFSPGVLAAGLYRVSYYARCTTAAGVSSGLIVTFGWTDGGVACALASADMTGNTTATTQSGTSIIRIDAGSAITYATTYASNAAGVMRYALDVVLEKVLA